MKCGKAVGIWELCLAVPCEELPLSLSWVWSAVASPFWGQEHFLPCLLGMAFSRCLVNICWVIWSLGKRKNPVVHTAIWESCIHSVSKTVHSFLANLIRNTWVLNIMWPTAGRTKHQVCPQHKHGDNAYDNNQSEYTFFVKHLTCAWHSARSLMCINVFNFI